LWESKQKPSSFLVLLAALNEEKGIVPTIKELKRFLNDPYFLVIDGRSVDRTIERAKKFDVDILGQFGNGKGNAIAQGIKYTDFKGKYAVIIDADYTYPAKFIPQMVKILDKKPKVGMVCGNRFNRKYNRRRMKSIYFIGNRILMFAHNFLNGVYLKDPLSGLRVVRWNILNKWKPKSSGFDIEVELNHFVQRQGYQIIEIPIELRPRLGKKKLNILDGITIFKRIILKSVD
jgi:dolichol-phosphate mannosyltransferase